MTFEQKALYDAIDQIFWNDWYPIGVNDIAPRDEYYGYIPQVFQLKIMAADKEKIATHLFEMETERMGLFGNLDHCREVADKIFKLSLNP